MLLLPSELTLALKRFLAHLQEEALARSDYNEVKRISDKYGGDPASMR